MFNISNVISIFSEEEHQQFISYLERRNKVKGSKNIQLYKLVRKGKSSSEICHELYKKDNKPAYHALRKRLLQSLVDFMANSSLIEENSIDMQAIKYILASRTFLLHKKYKLAFKLLAKAETMAMEHHQYSLLNEIYHTKIQYAHTNETINLEDEILKFQKNQENNLLEGQLNMVYAKLRRALDASVYKGEVLDFQQLFETILQEHNITVKETLSFKSLYQLISIVSMSAFITNDYFNMEPFLKNAYTSLENHKNRDKDLYYRIQVLYLIANTLFRNKKFKSSMNYLDLMLEQMNKKHQKYYNSFKLKYGLLRALNLNFMGEQEKAMALLESMDSKRHEDMESLLDIKLSLAMFHFQMEDYKGAHKVLSNFYHTDKWYIGKAGVEWSIKKNLIEILLHMELDNQELVDSRLLSFKRSYFKYLKEIQQERVITYVSLVEYYYNNREKVSTPEFHQKVEESFDWIDAKREDIFVMSFFAWLKSKMESKPIFSVTMNLIAKARNQS